MKKSTRETLKIACKLIAICYYKNDVQNADEIKNLSAAMDSICKAIKTTFEEAVDIRCFARGIDIILDETDEE